MPLRVGFASLYRNAQLVLNISLIDSLDFPKEQYKIFTNMYYKHNYNLDKNHIKVIDKISIFQYCKMCILKNKPKIAFK